MIDGTPTCGIVKENPPGAATRIMQAAGSPNAKRLALSAVSYLIQQGSFPPLELRKPESAVPDQGAVPDRAGVELGASPD